MIVVGLTGGIGSGKSTLAGALSELGVPVIDADAVSRRCVEPGGPVLGAIVERFGPGVLLPDGALDRAGLARIVFSDDVARRDLEAITHPCIRAGIDGDLEALRASASPPPVAVVEHPLLVETGSHERVDVVVVVEAPLRLRVARLTAGRAMTEEDVRARIAAQVPDEVRRASADLVVDNSGDASALRTAAAEVLALAAEVAGEVAADDAGEGAGA